MHDYQFLQSKGCDSKFDKFDNPFICMIMFSEKNLTKNATIRRDPPSLCTCLHVIRSKGVLHMCSSAQINRKPEYRSLFANIMLSL